MKQLVTWLLICLFLSVGLWIGLFSLNTSKFESLEIREATVEATEEGWLVTMQIRNFGTMDSVISRVEVNGTELIDDAEITNAYRLAIPVTREAEVWVKIRDRSYDRGTTAEIAIVTRQENRYILLVVLGSEIWYTI